MLGHEGMRGHLMKVEMVGGPKFSDIVLAVV
jgi:hypothetical protein